MTQEPKNKSTHNPDVAPWSAILFTVALFLFVPCMLSFSVNVWWQNQAANVLTLFLFPLIFIGALSVWGFFALGSEFVRIFFQLIRRQKVELSDEPGMMWLLVVLSTMMALIGGGLISGFVPELSLLRALFLYGIWGGIYGVLIYVGVKNQLISPDFV